MSTLRVADVVPYPGGRHIADGQYSGEWFRETILRHQLKHALDTGSTLNVELDDVPGYGVSFLEEAFGGLLRDGLFSPQQMRSLHIVANNELYKPFKVLADKYIKDASRVMVRP